MRLENQNCMPDYFSYFQNQKPLTPTRKYFFSLVCHQSYSSQSHRQSSLWSNLFVQLVSTEKPQTSCCLDVVVSKVVAEIWTTRGEEGVNRHTAAVLFFFAAFPGVFSRVEKKRALLRGEGSEKGRGADGR